MRAAHGAYAGCAITAFGDGGIENGTNYTRRLAFLHCSRTATPTFPMPPPESPVPAPAAPIAHPILTGSPTRARCAAGYRSAR
jgi:hypothetical protein